MPCWTVHEVAFLLCHGCGVAAVRKSACFMSYRVWKEGGGGSRRRAAAHVSTGVVIIIIIEARE